MSLTDVEKLQRRCQRLKDSWNKLETRRVKHYRTLLRAAGVVARADREMAKLWRRIEAATEHIGQLLRSEKRKARAKPAASASNGDGDHAPRDLN